MEAENLYVGTNFSEAKKECENRSCDQYAIFNVTNGDFSSQQQSSDFFPAFFNPSLLSELGFHFSSLPIQQLEIVVCHGRGRQNGEHYGEN